MEDTVDMGQGAHPSSVREDLERVAAFHGHVCPGLAYGVRVARTALRELGGRAVDEELVAVVENDSCSVDAIQVLTGCTFGKGNLVHRDTGKSVYTFFRRRPGIADASQGIRVAVDLEYDESPGDQEAWRRFRSGERDPDLLERIGALKEAKIALILDSPEDRILRVTEVSESPPEKARIFPSVRCTRCGEKVMEPRARLSGGQILCIPCFEKT